VTAQDMKDSGDPAAARLQQIASLQDDIIPRALESLQGRSSYAAEVIQWCSSAHETEDPADVKKQMKEYLLVSGVVQTPISHSLFVYMIWCLHQPHPIASRMEGCGR
jgi:hypothetical protein